MSIPSLLKSALDQMSDAVCVLDIQAHLLYLNGPAQELTGWDQEAAIGKKWRDVMGDNGVPAKLVLAEDEAARKALASGTFQAPLTTRSGRLREIAFSTSPLVDAGECVGTLMVMRDVFAGLGDETAPDLDYGSLVENVNSIILAMDLEGRITFFNRFAEEFFGYTSGEIMGRSIIGTIVPETEASGRDLRDIVARICADPEAYESHENENNTKDGRRVWVSWTNKVIRSASGQCVGIISVGNDITVAKLAEQALRDAHAQLELRVAGRTRELTRLNEELQKEISERKRTEAELVTERDRLEKVTQSMAVGLAVVARDYTITWANDVLQNVYGEVVGKVCRDAIKPQNEDYHCEVRKVFEGGKPFAESEIRAHDIHGREVWVHLMATPIKNDAGEVTSALQVCVPITQRKQAEEQVRRQAIEKGTILNALTEHVIYHDTEMRILWANRAAADSAQLAPSDMPGRLCHNIWHQRDEPCDACPVVMALETGEPHENEITSPDGKVWLIRGYPVKDDDGKTIGAVETSLDISDRKRAEAAVAEGERRLSMLMSNIPGMAYRCRNDKHWTMEFVSEGSVELTGYEPGDLVMNSKVSYAQLIHPEDQDGVWENVQSAVAKQGPFKLSYRLITKSGDEKWVWEQGRGVFSANDELIALEGLITDNTEGKRAEEAQRLAAVGQLAAGIAHEFNNLLASMMLGAELALQRSTATATQQLSELVLRATGRGAEICRNLTSFARPKPPKLVPVRIEDAIETALAVAAPQIESSGTKLQREYATQGVRVYADASQLEQVFLNLIINACQAMPVAGMLSVKATYVPSPDDAGLIVAHISDTGHGIEADDLPHIFEPFFTTKGTVGQGEMHGTGLGLSVSHSIIAAHGGTIDVRSEVGVGTVFSIHLRAYETDVKHGRGETVHVAVPVDPQTGEALRILLAEDEDDLRELVAETLSEKGFAVTAVGAAPDAIEALGSDEFDLIITDLLMPGGGRSVLSHVGTMEEQPPVIVITGKAIDVLPEEYHQLTVKACVRKPFSIANLVKSITMVTA